MAACLCVYIDVQQTIEAWRTVFYIAAAVYAFATIFYGIFGSGELQPWAKQSESPMPQELEVDVQLNPRQENRRLATQKL